MGPKAREALPTKEAALFRQIVRFYEMKQYKKGLKAADQILKCVPGGRAPSPRRAVPPHSAPPAGLPPSLLRPPSTPTDNFRAERAGAPSPAVPSDSALRGGARPLTSGPLPARPPHRPQEVPRTRGDAVDEGPDLELPRPQARGL